ncbi:signal peptidase I [Brachybacterium sp. YJGR34]|uniref:signal peptidase I n=1 Tax=Brachybacterium sp. YJGR34 TaxID=2059911 RepID=UPI000E0AD4E6|nr:signal peptidase I [Brachybacterium sp. YJGR34]
MTVTAPALPAAPAARRRPRHRTALRLLGDLLLAAAAALGLLCMVLALLTGVFGFRVMLFSSGSMEPSIPVGSAALVAPTAAADVEVGDVVTVDRAAGELPVTHRVVAVEGADDPAQRLLTLRGDANAQNDPTRYLVDEVGRVVVSAPGVAPLVASAGTSRVLAPLGVVAAGCVVWALWPRGGTGSRE